MENGSENNEKIEQLLKKQLFASRVAMVCGIILSCCFVIITLSIVKVVPQVTKTMEQIDAVTADAEAMLAATGELEKELTVAVSEFNKVLPSLGEASESIASISKSLDDEGLPKLYETLDNLEGLKKLEDINIEELNGAIQSLHDVVEPLARLFGR